MGGSVFLLNPRILIRDPFPFIIRYRSAIMLFLKVVQALTEIAVIVPAMVNILLILSDWQFYMNPFLDSGHIYSVSSHFHLTCNKR